MKITYYGHACFGVSYDGHHLLFDPYISPNPKAEQIDIQQIPADYILISHGHGDHVADVESIGQRTGATLISNYEIISWFGAKGLQNAHPMNHGGGRNFPFGRVKYVQAVHSSSLPDGSYGGNPGGFVVEHAQGQFYYSGDTALHMDMKLLGTYQNLDLAFLCIGDNFTMDVSDAVIAADFIGCDTIIGMHYDTFGWIEIDHAAAVEAFAAKGKTLHLMEIGSTLTIQ